MCSLNDLASEPGRFGCVACDDDHVVPCVDDDLHRAAAAATASRRLHLSHRSWRAAATAAAAAEKAFVYGARERIFIYFIRLCVSVCVERVRACAHTRTLTHACARRGILCFR